jgi:STE24 endopeptidase
MMNTYAIVGVAALVAQYLLSTLADALNVSAMTTELPSEFRDVYDAETYARSQQYTRERTRFSHGPRTMNLLLMLGFWFAGGFGFVDTWLRGFGWSGIVTGLVFWGVLLAGQSILNLPFSLYSTFVIEERYGFNRTTMATFVSDMLKGIALGVVLGAPFGALILWLFQTTGALAWVYCWAALSAGMLLLQLVAPAWLMPLFIKFAPLADGPLRQQIFDYARAVDFPLQNLFVVDGSRRSTKANAFFTGFGKNRRIGLFDTLIERHSPDELVAIVAHEVGHYKKKHVTRGMVIGLGQTALLLFVFGLLLRQPGLYQAFGMEQMPIYAGFIFCGILYEPAGVAMSILMNARSRSNEYEADAFAVETTGLGHALASGLKRLAASTLGNLTPHPLYVLLHATHPPLSERVAAIHRASSNSRQGTPAARLSGSAESMASAT